MTLKELLNQDSNSAASSTSRPTTSPNSTLVCVSLSPLVPTSPNEPGKVETERARHRQQIEDSIAKAEGRIVRDTGELLVAQFSAIKAGVGVALEIQRRLNEYNDRELPINRLVLGVGLHFSGSDPVEGWSYGPGQRVVTALCASAKGTRSVYASAAVKAAVKGVREYRFEDMGEINVEGMSVPVRVHTICETSAVSEVLAIFDHLPRVDSWVIAAGGIALALAFFAFSQGLEETPVESIQKWEFFEDAPPRSLAVLPFAEGGFRASDEAFGDAIPARLIDDFAHFEGLELAARNASFEFRNSGIDLQTVGEKLGVEGIVMGYASASGDWILVRAAVVRVDDQSEIWTGAYYERIADIEVIQRQLLEGIMTALELEPPGPSVASAQPLTGLAPEDLSDSEYGALKSNLEDALKDAQGLEIDEHERIISMNNLASLYYDSGRDADAIPIYEEVVAKREHMLGPNHPQVAVSLNNLASSYVAVGRYEEAEPLYLRSLRIREKSLGSNHPRVGNALNNLASLYQRMGRFAAAEKLYERAIEVRMRDLEFELGNEASRLREFGVRAELSGNYTEARKFYEEALAAEVKEKGKESLSTTSLRRSIAETFARKGQTKEAKSWFDGILSLTKGKISPQHPELARTKGDLGEMHRREGQLVEAERYHEDSLHAFEASYGTDNPAVASSLSYLVSIFELQGRDEEAAEAGDRAKAIRTMYLGPVFTYVAARSTSQRVAKDRIHDDLSAPQPLHEYGVMIDAGELVEEKLRFADSLHDLALLYVEQGRYSRAEELNLRALEIRQSVTGREEPLVALSLHSLARVYTLQHRLDVAKSHYDEARLIFETSLGRVHPHVARCWEDLAELHRLANRTNEADHADERAREIRTALNQAENPVG